MSASLPEKVGVRLLPGRPCRRGASHEIEHRGKEIDRSGLLLHPQPGRHSRSRQQKHNAQARVIKEHPVIVLTVFPQTLSMIRKHGDQSLIRRENLWQRR